MPSQTGTMDVRFSLLFDRALAACARAQQLATRCRESQAQARSAKASAHHLRALAAETRGAWADSSSAFLVMRRQVETLASRMREAGIDRERAGATMRAHIRYVLYDGGLREQEAEPVVANATRWVDEIYQAA
jgi:hypothetical protein